MEFLEVPWNRNSNESKSIKSTRRYQVFGDAQNHGYFLLRLADRDRAKNVLLREHLMRSGASPGRQMIPLVTESDAFARLLIVCVFFFRHSVGSQAATSRNKQTKRQPPRTLLVFSLATKLSPNINTIHLMQSGATQRRQRIPLVTESEAFTRPETFMKK